MKTGSSTHKDGESEKLDDISANKKYHGEVSRNNGNLTRRTVRISSSSLQFQMFRVQASF